MKRKILITGGQGFIGSSLTNKLLKLGHEVATLDAQLHFIENPEYYKRCLLLRKKRFKNKPSKVYKGDIRNFDEIKKIVFSFKPHTIIHLAGLPMARVLQNHKHEMIPINLNGTLNVLRAFEESTATRFVYTSSSMVYGHFKQTPQSEQFILDPINEYGATKAAGEYFVKQSQKEWVIVRPTSVYGFADCANRVTQLLIDAAYLKKPAWVVQGETLDFSYVEDVVEGFVKCAIMPKANQQTFNISRGVARAAAEFAAILQNYFPDFRYEIRNHENQQVWRGPQDITKAMTLLNFAPQYDIEKGIKEILEFNEQYDFYNFSK
jgi:nucleoside-diphosphate-sugar epimerase